MRVLYYLVSGRSHVGYFAAKTWNYYCLKVQHGGVSRTMVCADSQILPMYECIVVGPSHHLSDEELYEDGVLNGETDDEDDWGLRQIQSQTSSTRGTEDSQDSRGCTPMSE